MNCTTTYTAPTQSPTLLPLHLTPYSHYRPQHRSYRDPTITSVNATNASSSSASLHRIAVFHAAGYNHDKYDPTHLNYHRLHFRCLLLLQPFPPFVRQHFVPPHICCRSCRVSSQFWSAAHHLAHRLRSLLHPISITHSPHSRSSRRTLLFCIRRFCFRCSAST